MPRRLTVRLTAVLGLATGLGAGAFVPAVAADEFSDYRTTATALTTDLTRSARPPTGRTGYLGLTLRPDTAPGQWRVDEVETDSPADHAGIRPGDGLRELDGAPLHTPDQLRAAVQTRGPGERVRLGLERAGKAVVVVALLAATSEPMATEEGRAGLGARFTDWDQGEGALVERIEFGTAAAEGGLRAGDILLELDGEMVPNGETARSLLEEKQPGDLLRLRLQRRREEVKLEIRLPRAPDPVENRARTYWHKPNYRLAVIPVEFPDVRHNPAVTPADWTEFLFSTNQYRNKDNPTGQPVHGSLRDYYDEVSTGALQVTGQVLEWVGVSRNRAEYAAPGDGGNRAPFLFREALDAVYARAGATDPLRGFDGLLFIYAGERFGPATRRSLYWPHMAPLFHRNQRWNTLVCPEGGGRMADISVYCHEFGHLLGWPDLYARAENPGGAGLGFWCLMSQQTGGGRPQHPSAWCKEQLGWLHPVVLDPTVKQKLLLGPMEGAAGECYKVLVRRDGSEYFLLENRRHQGFDEQLPGEGLLIWRVVGGRPILEAAHGVGGPAAPRLYPSSVPFPSRANQAFTPHTTPSSRSRLGGGLPVFLTHIRRLPDGRIAFQIGSEFD